MVSIKLTLFSTVLVNSILFGLPINLLAGTPIKSIDSSGNVTYSDKPVSDAKSVSKVVLPPGPSESEINAAKQQAEKNIDTAENIKLPHEQSSKQKKSNNKASQNSTEAEQKVINAGSRKQLPAGTLPKPRPPVERPGINPPPVARPGQGVRGR